MCVSARGARILDDTVLPTPLATALERLAWVYSSQERTPIDGFARGVLVWTHGPCRVPWGVRRWRTGGPSPDAWALARLRYARTRLRCRPAYGLCDAWSPAKARLTRMRDDGGDVVCRLKPHRRFHGQPLRAVRRPPYGAERGWRTGGVNVLVVRDGAKDSATPRLPLPAVEVRRHDRRRAHIEEGIRACQDPLGLGGCHARSGRAPRQHLPGGCVAFWVLERACQDQGVRRDKLTWHLSVQGRSVALPALERLRSAAEPLSPVEVSPRLSDSARPPAERRMARMAQPSSSSRLPMVPFCQRPWPLSASPR